MKVKSTIAFLLMSITFLLNVIPLIPHHHHNNDITSICLFNDGADNDIAHQDKTPFNNTNCPECWTTNITPFKINSPNNLLQQVDFTVFITLTHHNIFDFTPPCFVLKTKSTQYLSKVYNEPICFSSGLRAPPSLTTI